LPNTKSIHRSIATLKLPKTVGALVTYAQGIVTAMTGNAAFPSPVPPLPTVTTAINELQTSETTAQTRAKGTVTARNDKRAALVTLLQQLRGYVQTTADANAETSATLIESAGISVRKTPTRAGRIFTAAAGAVSGSAKLVVPRAGNRVFYEWEYSTDGGKTWITAPATLQAKTTITGLAPATTVLFRYRTVTKTGEGDWSQPVSLLVK
jgi:hypothetical protein